MQRHKPSKKKNATHGPTLTPDQKDLVERILREARDADPLECVKQIPDPVVAVALLDGIPISEGFMVPLVRAVAARFEQKLVQKAVKRMVFRMRQKGIDPRGIEPKTTDQPLFKPAAKEDALALMGPLDAQGTRPVFMAIPLVPQGFEVGIGVVSDEQGILHFLSGAYSKKGMNEMKGQFLKGSADTVFVEATPAHAARVLEMAYSAGRESPNEATEAYASFRTRVLSHVSPLDHPAIHDHRHEIESAGSGRGLTHSQIEKLLDQPLLKTWTIDPEHLKPLLEEIAQLQDSPLILSTAQQADRVRELERQWAKTHFMDSRKTLFRQRFEEMAYVFFKQQEAEYARLSLMAAEDIARDAGSSMDATVLDFLLERSLKGLLKARRESKAHGSDMRGDQIIA
jgi:hypothetical protein